MTLWVVLCWALTLGACDLWLAPPAPPSRMD